MSGRPLALANTYAALAELYHFSRPDTGYELRVNARLPPVLDAGPPFSRCLCLPLAAAADDAGRAQSTGLAAALLLRDLLTPLGRAADAARADYAAGVSPEAFCHTAADYRLSWPRRRLARRAGLVLAAYLLKLWTARDPGPVRAAVEAWLEEQWEARQLRPEQVVERLQGACAAALGLDPEAKFEAGVAPLAERNALGSRLDSYTACHALSEAIGLVGKPAGQDPDGAAGLIERAAG